MGRSYETKSAIDGTGVPQNPLAHEKFMTIGHQTTEKQAPDYNTDDAWFGVIAVCRVFHSFKQPLSRFEELLSRVLL